MSRAAGVSIEPSSRVARNDAIIFTEFGDTVVMMDVENGSYYELNPVGSRIWALTETGPRVADVCEALVAEYEVAPEACGNEVRAFLEELHSREVIRVPLRHDANEVGKDGTYDAEAVLIAGGGAALRDKKKPETRLAWTTPTIRVMAARQIAGGGYRPGGVEGALNFYGYPFPS